MRWTSKCTSMADIRRIKEVLEGNAYREYAIFGWLSVIRRVYSRADLVCVYGFVCRIGIGVKTTRVVLHCRKTDCSIRTRHHLECGSGEDIVVE